MVGLIRLIPAAVAAPFVAVLVDRHSRRAVLLATDGLRALLIGAAAAAVALDLPSELVFLLAAIVTVVTTAFEPAKNAILPALVRAPEQLTAANVATTTFESASMFAGPAIGGLLVAVANVETAFGFTAALLVGSTLLIARIRNPGRAERGEQRPEDERSGLAAEALAGIREIATDWRLRLIVGLTTAQLVVDGALGVLIVVMSVELLDLGEAGVGWLNAAAGIGGLLGSLVALVLTARRGLASVLGIGVAAWSAPLALIPLVPQAAPALVLLGFIGLANAVLDASLFTLLQRATRDEVRGRVFGALESLMIAGAAFGALAAAAAVEWIGVEGTLVAFGLFLPVLALLARPRLRRIDAELAAPAAADLQLLRGVPMFALLPAAPLETLAGKLRRPRVEAGKDVIRQGDEGDLFYVIADGGVEVFEDGVLARREVAGDHFGEIALIRDVPRTATVTAVTDVELIAVEREDFIAAVTGHAPSADAADAVIASRLGSVRAGAGTV